MCNEDRKIGIKDFIEFYHFYNNLIEYLIKSLDDEYPKIYIGILLILDKYGDLPISHVGEKLFIAKSNMTTLIDGMEETGFIKRNTSKDDRRIIKIGATAAGKKYLDETLSKLDWIIYTRNPSIKEEEGIEALEAMNLILKLGTKVLNGEK